MQFEQAKVEAVRIFGPGTTLYKQKDGKCFVQEAATGRTLGKGTSWLEALRDAAQPLLQREAEERSHRAQLEQAEAIRFATFLKEHHAEAYKSWRKKRDEENAKRLEEERKLSEEINAQVKADIAEEEAAKAAETPSPIIAP